MALIGRVAALVAILLLARGIDAAPAQPARAQLEAEAQGGRAEAAYDLGLDYDLGTSGVEDSASALHWYRRAGEAGLPAAEFNVGVMLDAGRGVARDPAAAAIWYAKAAVHGHDRAAYDLGQLYAAGDGPPANQAAAAAWFARASALPAAARRLAAMKAKPVPDAAQDAALLAPMPTSPADRGGGAADQGGGGVRLDGSGRARPGPLLRRTGSPRWRPGATTVCRLRRRYRHASVARGRR